MLSGQFLKKESQNKTLIFKLCRSYKQAEASGHYRNMYDNLTGWNMEV